MSASFVEAGYFAVIAIVVGLCVETIEIWWNRRVIINRIATVVASLGVIALAVFIGTKLPLATEMWLGITAMGIFAGTGIAGLVIYVHGPRKTAAAPSLPSQPPIKRCPHCGTEMKLTLNSDQVCEEPGCATLRVL